MEQPIHDLATDKLADGAEAMLRGALPLFWICLISVAMFSFFMPTDDPQFGELISLMKSPVMSILCLFVAALVTYITGWPTRREILASMAAMVVAMTGIFGVAVGLPIIGLSNPFWFLVALFFVVIPSSRLVFSIVHARVSAL